MILHLCFLNVVSFFFSTQTVISLHLGVTSVFQLWHGLFDNYVGRLWINFLFEQAISPLTLSTQILTYFLSYSSNDNLISRAFEMLFLSA